jgi:hypothetical protein
MESIGDFKTLPNCLNCKHVNVCAAYRALEEIFISESCFNHDNPEIRGMDSQILKAIARKCNEYKRS